MSTDLNMEYQEVKFGEICREIKLTTKNPIADGYDKYIGLEHLDSGSLKIKRWGLIAEDNPTFTRVFKKGHILIGKRRPYLKKAAIAEFDGICSSDIIVVEAKIDSYSEFLPFLIQSEKFWSHAVTTSSGSLSPRTKFKDLAELIFKLPKYDFKKIILVNHKYLENLHVVNEALISANQLYKVLSYHLFNESKSKVKLENICLKIQDGTHFSPKSVSSSGDFIYFTSKNIRMGEMTLDTKEYISKAEHAQIYTRCNVRKGDILLTKDGANTGNICINDLEEEISLLSSVAFIRVDPKKSNQLYLFHYLMSECAQREIISQMAGNAITRLTLKKIKNLEIPQFSFKQQILIGKRLNSIFQTIKNLEKRRNILMNLQTSYMSFIN